MLGSSSVLFVALLIYVINAQQCGVINDNQQRIQMQGPPGKRAEVDYEKIKQIVGEEIKAEMAAEFEHGQIMEIVDKAVKAGMASITTEMGKMQTENRKLQTENRKMRTENRKMNTEMLKFRSEMDEMKDARSQSDTKLKEMSLQMRVFTKEIQKSEIPIILEDIVNDIMSGNDRNLSLQQLPKAFEVIPQTQKEVKFSANKYKAKKKYIHSIILYYTAGMMAKSTGNTGVRYKRYRVQDIGIVGLKMDDEKRDFTVFKFWVIPLMEKLLEQLRHITGATRKYKVESQSWCLRDIAFFSYLLGDYENEFNKSKLCVDTMRQLGKNANNYGIFASCLHDSGAALYNLGKYSEAVSYYEEAIDVFKSATDFSSELIRREYLASANEQLEDAKSEIGL